MVTDRIGFGSAQADHPLRFAFLGIRQQGVGIENTGNNGGYDLNIIDSLELSEIL